MMEREVHPAAVSEAATFSAATVTVAVENLQLIGIPISRTEQVTSDGNSTVTFQATTSAIMTSREKIVANFA